LTNEKNLADMRKTFKKVLANDKLVGFLFNEDSEKYGNNDMIQTTRDELQSELFKLLEIVLLDNYSGNFKDKESPDHVKLIQ
jgi:hypothetical protein